MATVTIIHPGPEQKDPFGQLPVLIISQGAVQLPHNLVQVTYELKGDEKALQEAQAVAARGYQAATVPITAADLGAPSRLTTAVEALQGPGYYRAVTDEKTLRAEEYISGEWVPVYLSPAQLATLSTAWATAPTGWYAGSWLTGLDLPTEPGTHKVKRGPRDYRAWPVGDRNRLLTPAPLPDDPTADLVELPRLTEEQRQDLMELALPWDLTVITLDQAPGPTWVRLPPSGPGGGPWSTAYFPWRAVLASLRAGGGVPVPASDGKTYEYLTRADWLAGQLMGQPAEIKRVGTMALDMRGEVALVLLRRPGEPDITVDEFGRGRTPPSEQQLQTAVNKLQELWDTSRLDTAWSRAHPGSGILLRPWRTHLGGQTVAALLTVLEAL